MRKTGLYGRASRGIGNTESGPIRKVVAALAYLRNPYDHIFDLHTEGGFVDDIDEIQKAWSALLKAKE